MDPDQKKKCSDVLEYFFALDSTGAFSCSSPSQPTLAY